MSTMPLGKVRILDVCNYLAGPFTLTLLAYLGAEVIKVESIQRLDYLRMMGGYPQPDGYEWSPAFNAVNINKYGITLDLTNPQGKEIFRRLVKISDVVAQNFSSRVMSNWGLSYEVLREINPRIIMLSMPGFGTTGPWRDYVTFGPNVEMMAGIPTVTGYLDGPPMMNGYTADPFASLTAAVAVMVALQSRRRTGRGQHIDLSQVEAVTAFMAGPIMDYSMNKRLQHRKGNRHRSLAPHGVYRCKGDDEWVAIAVCSEDEWRKLCDAMGNPSWANDPRFAEPLNRHKNQDELDRIIEDWTCEHDKYEVMEILQRAGVAAAPVLRASEILSNPHMEKRRFFQEVTHPVTGSHRYYGFPVKFSETPVSIRMPAPTLGQHNEYILTGLLGMSEEEISHLVKEKVIGTKPQGWPYSLDVEQESEKDRKFHVMDGGSGLQTKAKA
jgi:crotonobetainyl-CoA:carnitine CoA-transferase CaiB-like acyl-CoA transferase